MAELIELKCRNCGSTLAPEHISAQLAAARCPHCHALFALPASLAAPPSIPRPEVALPPRFTLRHHDGTLTITRRWFSPVAFFLLFFAVFWNGFLIVWHTIALSGGMWFMSAFGLIHTAVGLWLIYWVAAMFMNSTVIHASRDWLQVRCGPLPWPGKQDLPRPQIHQLYCTEKVSHGKNGSSAQYRVEAVLDGNRRATLAKGFANPEQALFVEQQLEKFLGIADLPVAGEHGR